MEAGSVVRAVFEFLPSVSEELPLFAGDVVEVLSVVDEFWLLGIKDGVSGQFPSTFVESVTVPPTKAGEQLYVCISDFNSSEPDSLPLKRGDVVAGEGNVDAGWHRGRNAWGSRGLFPLSCMKELELSGRSRQLSERSAAAQDSELPPYALGQGRALMSLHAQLDEELDFREGDIITIVGMPEPGWFQGELEGRTGIFPEGFVELLSPLRSLQSAKPISLGQEHYPSCRVDEEEEKEEEEEEEEEKRVKEGVEMQTQEEHEEEAGVYGIAQYEFRALEPGELDFDVGDRIQILKTLEDGWLEGQLRGKRGIFPHRFVKMEEHLEEQVPSVSEKNGTSDKEEVDSYASEYSCDQEDQALLAHDQDRRSHEDYTVWDLDYFEKREECRESCLRDTQSEICQDRTTVQSVHPNQPGPRRQERPPPPLVHPSRPGNSGSRPLQRTNSGNLIPPRPQLPPRPCLRNRQISTSNHSSPPEPPPVPSTRNTSLNRPTRISSNLQSNSSWTRNKGYYASHDSRNPFNSRRSDSQAKSRQKKLTRHASISDADLGTYGHGEHNIWSQEKGINGLPTSHTLGSLSGDLETKLTQQLLEFEKSLPGSCRESEEQSMRNSHGRDLLTRHFSIMDYSNESDIIKGSYHSLPHDSPSSSPNSSLERRKTRRPPPPRPRFLRPPAPRSSHNHSSLSNGQVPQQTTRPMRQAPRPPPPCPRPPVQPSDLLVSTEDEEATQEEKVEEAEDALERERDIEQEREREQEQYRLLLRLEEVERDIDMYTHTAHELNAMLEDEGEEDEVAHQQALENLEFCNYTVETLTLEKQQLQGNLFSEYPSFRQSHIHINT
ncbi:hypothetical protein AMELA_G00112890 [Ameiurus melas]|uniref:SH3 domain-containing protein n=1 Tax=Ameiurus melas TaxID=219545 RepID=A0A7J6ASF2_AMEME|nr:hypothetical protein AMELA_G00112890 [Ameiurus melas]